MFIGIARFELHISAARSLKDKRQVLRSITQDVQNRFPVSIAEVEYQNLWQRAALGVACVAESGAHVRKVLQSVEKAIARGALAGAETIDREFEVVAWEDL